METRRATRKKLRLERGEVEVSEDRLSNLPKPLIHEIVSCLPSRSVAYMSTLSRNWEYFLGSFPGLFFDEQEFHYKNDTKNDRRLCQFMSKYSLCQTPIAIQKIRIGTAFLRFRKNNHQIDRCLDLALPSEIRELNLKFRHSHIHRYTRCRCYDVPGRIFSLGVNLTHLDLLSCRLGDLDDVNVPSMKTISLKYVHISTDALFRLVVACPSLESLVLEYCFGLRRFKIQNPSLMRLVINYFRESDVFHIECALLQSLECKAKEIHDPGNNLKISDFQTSCGVLKDIYFARVNMRGETIEHIFSSSPHVKSLTMRFCKVEGTIKVCPQELKHLMLEDTYLPQLDKGLYSIESFTFGINVFGFRSLPDNVSHGHEILCSTLVNIVHLKSLSLQGIVLLSDESLEYVISICPFLSDLCLLSCSNLRHIRIISNMLKTLSITASTNEELDCEIETPNLKSFKFEGPVIQINCVVISNELEAQLHFREYDDSSSPVWVNRLQQYVWWFKEAKKLTLGNYVTECVLTPDEATVPSLFYHGHVRASLNMGRKQYKEFLSQMLLMSPCRSSLSLNFEVEDFPSFSDSLASLGLKFTDDRHQGVIIIPDVNHDCIRDHLYEISVQITKASTNVINLLKFVLGKATQLRKLMIIVDSKLPARVHSKIIFQIKAIKKVSQSCEIILC